LRLGAVVLLGMVLAWRLNFAPVLLVLGVTAWRRGGFRSALVQVGIVGAIAAAVTVPFVLHDLAHFTPLMTAGHKAAYAPGGRALVTVRLLLVAGAVAIVAEGSAGGALRATAWALLLPTLPVAIGAVVRGHGLEMAEYVVFSIPFLIGGYAQTLCAPAADARPVIQPLSAA
jgi:hypothetical protein